MQHKIEACSLKIRLVGGVIYRCCYKWRKINWYIRLIVRRRQELDAIWMFRVLKGKSGIYPISSPNLLKCQFPANFWANPFPISSFLIFISSHRDPNPIFPMKNRQIRLSSQFTPRGPSTVNGPSLESIILCLLLFDFPFFVAVFFLTVFFWCLESQMSWRETSRDTEQSLFRDSIPEWSELNHYTVNFKNQSFTN